MREGTLRSHHASGVQLKLKMLPHRFLFFSLVSPLFYPPLHHPLLSGAVQRNSHKLKSVRGAKRDDEEEEEEEKSFRNRKRWRWAGLNRCCKFFQPKLRPLASLPPLVRDRADWSQMALSKKLWRA